MQSPADLCLEIKAEPRFIAAINALTEEFFQAVDPIRGRSKLLFSLQLVVSEVCSNVARHAYPYLGSGRLRLEIWVSATEVTIQVSDYGQGFDPEQIPRPDLDQPHESGYGLYLVKQSVDEFSYRRGPDRNVLRCIVKL